MNTPVSLGSEIHLDQRDALPILGEGEGELASQRGLPAEESALETMITLGASSTFENCCFVRSRR